MNKSRHYSSPNGEPNGLQLVYIICYRHLEGPFWLKWKGKNLVQKRPVGGSKFVK